jgi:flagellar biosynthesis protein FliQ
VIVSLFCDLLYLGGAEAALWSPLALYTMVGGFVVALAAAVPRFKEFGLAHVPVNLIVTSLYALNLWLRLGDAPNTGVAIALSVTGVGLLAVSSWLGGARAPVQGVSE